ncbi:hypothetical protein LBBP_01701 [Leptospira borgpetersenii serovar Ballum]|uniref:Uncharacterized protein n=1 Tax=Leptospira borgpetersenii serovar Ballum TaxID=280505 RepID=A0A0S2IQP1_LEPBO|nr:hypothetical protein LBBP_01701 [Leptospira borgpetersenii serovar Ballum]
MYVELPTTDRKFLSIFYMSVNRIDRSLRILSLFQNPKRN